MWFRSVSHFHGSCERRCLIPSSARDVPITCWSDGLRSFPLKREFRPVPSVAAGRQRNGEDPHNRWRSATLVGFHLLSCVMIEGCLAPQSDGGFPRSLMKFPFVVFCDKSSFHYLVWIFLRTLTYTVVCP